jgi:hypothetical protein
MTQRFLVVAGMLRRYLSLLRPMREVYEAEGCMPVHQLTGFDVKTRPQNRVACVIRLILLALCVCLCHVENHVDEYPNVCISISLELLFKALSSLLLMRWVGRGWRVSVFTRFYQLAHSYIYHAISATAASLPSMSCCSKEFWLLDYVCSPGLSDIKANACPCTDRLSIPAWTRIHF